MIPDSGWNHFIWFSHQRGAAPKLARGESPPATGQSRVVLVVPVQQLLLTDISIPSRSRQQLLQALPYALEEQLCQEVEALHFALIGREWQRQQVAVTSNALMQQWLQLAEGVGFALYRLVPDLLLLPWREQSWSVVVEGDKGWLRTGRYRGTRLATTQLGALLPALLEAEEASQRPEKIYWYGEPIETDLPESIERVEEPLPPEGVAGLMAGQLAQLPAAVNLLQGRYSRQSGWGRYLRPWRNAALLLLTLMALLMADNLFKRQQLLTQEQALQQQIEQLYRETFPDARNIVNAKLQMERRLANMQQPKAQQGFIDLMALSMPIIAATPGSTLTILRYKQSALEIDLMLESLPTLDRLKQQLQQQGLVMSVQSATSGRSGVNSRIVITMAQE